MNKFNAKKVTIDGITFMSTKEGSRYCQLKLMQKAGMISNLELQKPYELIPAQRLPDTIGKRGGVKKGKVIEQSVVYNADFVYIENGKEIVEDSKGIRTKDYVIKRKLMLYILKIKIKET